MPLKSFEKHINQNFPFLKEGKLIIAISGGIDSVVLAHLCSELNLKFSLAHCNFNLRGDESNEDEAFVLELGEDLDVEVFIQNFDTEDYAKQHKVSIQMAARELRYDWFQDLAESLNFDYIVTAHHADDNLETFLINFTRGTGLNGLTGIPEVKDNIVRPLLPFSREQIEGYAKSESIKWREDSSNSSRKYLRNKLRHDVVPILKEINPQLLESFQSTISNLNDTADIVDESLSAVTKRAIVDINESGITYKVSELKKVNNPKAYLFEMFKEYGFAEWNDIVDLLDAETGKYVVSNTHKLLKHREYLILSDICHSERLVRRSFSEGGSDESFTITGFDKSVKTPIGTLTFQAVDAVTSPSKNTTFVDKDTLNFPLELRLWKKGDYFYPIGMKGKKKLSKYLKDEKLMPSEKENTWLLLSGDAVVWVIGHRADDRFKITEKTKNILKLHIES
ncbi:tRNA lysidine(34) synthetase TilS [Winogradskyella sp. A3E31]|uniref:tRNA lysidine(34) synthetase TilS n=1 Tax=Winogradskyella sp. A3E31 TaxID=3349637 RepID=UPI00398AA3EC